MPAAAKPSPVLIALCQNALKSLAGSCPGVALAYIATKDGHVLASLTREGVGAKIAVMGGSMHALGDSIVAEARLGACNNVIIEAAEGKAVLLGITVGRTELVLTGISGRDTSLGLLLASCKSCCEVIRSRVAANHG